MQRKEPAILLTSLVPRPRVPPGEKQSGERSRIFGAYYPKWVMTNEIARSVIITYPFVKFVHLHLSIRTLFEWVGQELLHYCRKKPTPPNELI